VGEGDELRRDPQARQLQQATTPAPWQPCQPVSRTGALLGDLSDATSDRAGCNVMGVCLLP
jgi:hypothetical protein